VFYFILYIPPPFPGGKALGNTRLRENGNIFTLFKFREASINQYPGYQTSFVPIEYPIYYYLMR
jgi:hypothetical protein